MSGVTATGGHLDGVQLGQTGTAVLTGGASVPFRVDGQATHVPDMYDSTTPWNEMTGGTYANGSSTADLANANGDITFYHASYQTDTGWVPLFPNDNEAVALRGVFGGRGWMDSDTIFTLGCTNGALAKCTRWGYKPWTSAVTSSGSVDLGPLHRACARAAIADYCRDGKSHTVDGHHIDIFDKYGLIASDPTSSFVEATFDEGGAECIAALRIPDTSADAPEDCACPAPASTSSTGKGRCLVPILDEPSDFAGCTAAHPAPITVRDYD